MNETIGAFCTDYFEKKRAIEREEWTKQRERNMEKMKPYLLSSLAILVLVFALIVIGFLILHAIRKKISKRAGKMTQTPIIPFPTDGFKNYVSFDVKHIPPNVRIQANDKNLNYNSGYEGRIAAGKLIRMVMEQQSESFKKSWANWTRRLPYGLPWSSQMISIRMDGFEFGEKMHDFIPIGGVSSGSHFTYQMFGDNRIQVTYYYLEGGYCYVAGFCIYVKDPTNSGVYWSEDVVKNILNYSKYPIKNQESKGNRNNENSVPAEIVVLKNETEIEQKEEEETENDVVVVVKEQREENKIVDQETLVNNSVNPEAETESEQEEEEEDENEDTIWVLDDISPPTPTSEIKLTVKYCSRLQRNVMTLFNSEKAKHEEWNPIEKKMESEECEECSEGDLLSTYSTLSLV
uniref:SUN domain-containing protein n=1 Tax=Caenorhabditis tropicalis TaxID=1561998 RepID=A0A1I7UYI3_9PELO